MAGPRPRPCPCPCACPGPCPRAASCCAVTPIPARPITTIAVSTRARVINFSWDRSRRCLARSMSVPRRRTPVDRGRYLARRLERALHERAQLRHVIAGEVYPAVGLAQRSQRLKRRGRLRPPRSAIPGHPCPRHGERRLELRCVLRMDAGALLERPLLNLRGRPGGHRPGEIEVEADDDPLAPAEAV